MGKKTITPEDMLGRFFMIEVDGVTHPIHFKAERFIANTLIGHNEEQQTLLVMFKKINSVKRKGVEYRLDWKK